MAQEHGEQIPPATSSVTPFTPHPADIIKTYVVRTTDSTESYIRSEYQFDGEMGGFSPARFENRKPSTPN